MNDEPQQKQPGSPWELDRRLIGTEGQVNNPYQADPLLDNPSWTGRSAKQIVEDIWRMLEPKKPSDPRPGDLVPWVNPYPEGTLAHDMEELNYAWSVFWDTLVGVVTQYMTVVLQWATEVLEAMADWWETR